MVSETLSAAVRQCYAAFANEPRPGRLDASLLRDAEAILRDLSSAPLAELSSAAIGPYSYWAITTVGTGGDFRHFLPRILELAACEPGWPGAESPVIATKLERAEWRTWAADQQQAVLALFAAAFENALSDPRAPGGAGPWLCGLAIIGDEAAARIAEWRSAPAPEAALDLAALISASTKSLPRDGMVGGGFWDQVGDGVRREVGRELLTDATRDYLFAAAVTADAEDIWEIEQALLVLDWARDQAPT